MSDEESAPETEAERAERIRLKLMTSMFATVGYGTLAAAVIQPMASKGEVSGETILGAVIGLFFLAVALYIAPRGEPK